MSKSPPKLSSKISSRFTIPTPTDALYKVESALELAGKNVDMLVKLYASEADLPESITQSDEWRKSKDYARMNTFSALVEWQNATDEYDAVVCALDSDEA